MNNQDENQTIDFFDNDNNEFTKMFEDLDITLQSLKYPKTEIKKAFPILIKYIKDNKHPTQIYKYISFENLLRTAMNFLDNK